MRPTRPQSYQLTPEIVVRRDAEKNVWRVFVSGVRVYSTAGRHSRERALAHGRWLMSSSVGMPSEQMS